MRYDADHLMGIDLGRQGENLARTVEIDVSSMLDEWPEASISLLVKRNHDPGPYVANTEVRDGVLFWPITAADTAIAGDGKLELRAMCGEVLAKSVMGTTRVAVSLTGSETKPPAASQGWVERVLEAESNAQESAAEAGEAAKRAESAAERAENAATGGGQDGITPHIGDNGHWWLGDTDTGVSAQGPPGRDGQTITPGDGLLLGEDGTLSVQTTSDAEQDNTLPMTSAGVYTQLGNIAVLLQTI